MQYGNSSRLLVYRGFFTAFIMPYCMRPESKARCMRSSVTISRTTLYQMSGLSFRITGHGLYTPTQMECRHDGSVGAVQSAVSTRSSSPVPYSSDMHVVTGSSLLNVADSHQQTILGRCIVDFHGRTLQKVVSIEPAAKRMCAPP